MKAIQKWYAFGVRFVIFPWLYNTNHSYSVFFLFFLFFAETLTETSKIASNNFNCGAGLSNHTTSIFKSIQLKKERKKKKATFCAVLHSQGNSMRELSSIIDFFFLFCGSLCRINAVITTTKMMEGIAQE